MSVGRRRPFGLQWPPPGSVALAAPAGLECGHDGPSARAAGCSHRGGGPRRRRPAAPSAATPPAPAWVHCVCARQRDVRGLAVVGPDPDASRLAATRPGDLPRLLRPVPPTARTLLLPVWETGQLLPGRDPRRLARHARPVDPAAVRRQRGHWLQGRLGRPDGLYAR